MVALLFFLLLVPFALGQTPSFTGLDRAAKLKAAIPDVETVIRKWAAQRGVPGMSWGMVIDGETVAVKTLGMRQWPDKLPVETGTPFRIASMTKSFTALAVLKLRDEGKLSLDDEVARWIPEAARLRYPTSDTAPLRVRQLLTHSAGFPEDNPWGDQQLSLPFADLTRWLERGIPFSTPPDTAYEYSNYGFGLLGRIVERVSGRSYREYLESEILRPLGMTSSTLEPAEAKDAAVGYRRIGGAGGEYRLEPSLPHGAFGAMGGLVTTAPDLAKYVAFHLAAYPPRDGAEQGPVRRASVREMQRLWRYSGLAVRRDQPESALAAQAGGYGYGLRVASDCRFGHVVAHGGGLPGFGSYMMWLPEHGVGLFAMTNLTYAGPAAALSDAFDVLRRTGALEPRTWPPSPALMAAQQALFALWNEWKPEQAARVAANNLFLDKSAADRQAEIVALKKTVGRCELAGPVRAENWLRGEFDLTCERGSIVRMGLTLAPTAPEPAVQYWSVRAIQPFGAAMRKAAERVAAGKIAGGAFQARLEAFKRAYGGSCKLGPVLGGDGGRQGTVRLECAKGKADVELGLDAKGRTTGVSIVNAAGEACVP